MRGAAVRRQETCRSGRPARPTAAHKAARPTAAHKAKPCKLIRVMERWLPRLKASMAAAAQLHLALSY
jgi:hypothetical protein